MMSLSPRALDRILSMILFVIVLLSWGFVIYAAHVAAQWQLEKRFGVKT